MRGEWHLRIDHSRRLGNVFVGCLAIGRPMLARAHQHRLAGATHLDHALGDRKARARAATANDRCVDHTDAEARAAHLDLGVWRGHDEALPRGELGDVSRKLAALQ